MTLPDERYRAVIWASIFLQELAYDKKKYPRIPKVVRQEAYRILRHYPLSSDIQQAALKAPEIFQEQMEPLYRMVKKYEQEKKDV